MVGTLLGLLDEQLRYVRRVAKVQKQRWSACAAGNSIFEEDFLEAETEALLKLVLVERERIGVLTEIGVALGHRQPSRIRIAELVLYVGPELRDELLEVREALRDVADEMEALRSHVAELEYHSLGRVGLYLCPKTSADTSKHWLVERLREEGSRPPDPREPFLGPIDQLLIDDA